MTDPMDKSIFQPTASSTVNKKRSQKSTERPRMPSSGFNEMFSMDSTRNSKLDPADVSSQLEEERELARSSLHRADQVGAIPSRYLRRNYSKSETNFNISVESTISDSDILQTPKNTSTPRKSKKESNLSHSLAQLSHKIADKSVSIDYWVKDFKNAIQKIEEEEEEKENDDSGMFRPAEECASMLMADELSWRRKHDIPLREEQFSNLEFSEKESLGGFFQKRSDTLSVFPSESPSFNKDPIPLIEPSAIEEELINDARESLAARTSTDLSIKNKKSLQISDIQKMLSADYTLRTITNNLNKMGSAKPSVSITKSKDSSYTSDYSDNEAIKDICNKKVESDTSPLSSRSSSRASSAITSLQNGTLPIETTKCDLVWGCVKISKSVTKEFVIRNRSSKRLGIQLSLCSQEFKIRKDNRADSEPLCSNKILLHPFESREIIMSFIPTKIGAAVDELCFTSLDNSLKQTKKQCVKLYGYGGSSKVEFYNLTKDTTGKFWLPLGKLDDRSVISSKFSVKNKGDLAAFLYISINSVENTKIKVNPSSLVLQCKEEKEVTVTYKPSNEDYNFGHSSPQITSSVVDLAHLNVVYGSEVDRGRLRNICEKYIENKMEIDPIATALKEKFTGESMPIDLLKLKERTGNLRDIMKSLHKNQIVLTLERDPEQTIIHQFPDESGLYQSLYCDNTIIGNKTSSGKVCFVAPTYIVLILPYKHKDSIFLESQTNSRLNFMVSCQQRDLELKPKEGVLEPHSTMAISVKHVSRMVGDRNTFKVIIIVESEMFEVEVKVESLGHNKKNKSLLNCMV